MTIKKYQPSRLERVSAAIIGPSGIGKTSLVKSLVNAGEKVAIVASEPGLLVVRDEIKDGTVDAYEVNNIQALKDIYVHLKQNADGYSSIFFDSLSECSDLMFKELESKAKDTRAAYGDFAKTMVELIKAYRDLDSASVFFTVLPSVDTDDLNRRIIMPNVAGKVVKEKFTSLLDLVMYMDLVRDPETGVESRVLITGQHKNYPAKDRSGKLSLFEAPDLAAIKAKILSN